jgi:hypothetical protein
MHEGKPPWWPKPSPISATYCSLPSEGLETRALAMLAEIDFDDGHAKRTRLIDPSNPDATPSTPALERIGDCYSRIVDLEPAAAGKVWVQYSRDAKTEVPDVCLVQSAVKDGAFVGCVMDGVAAIPPEWLGSTSTVLVSIDFRRVPEEASREWYGTGEMRWDGNQAPRMQDVPASD